MLTRPTSKAEIKNLETANANTQVGNFQRGRMKHLASRVCTHAAKVPSSG